MTLAPCTCSLSLCRGLCSGGAHSWGEQGASRDSSHPLSQADQAPQRAGTLVSGFFEHYTRTCPHVCVVVFRPPQFEDRKSPSETFTVDQRYGRIQVYNTLWINTGNTCTCKWICNTAPVCIPYRSLSRLPSSLSLSLSLSLPLPMYHILPSEYPIQKWVLLLG